MERASEITLIELQRRIDQLERSIGQLRGELTVLNAIKDLQERMMELERKK